MNSGRPNQTYYDDSGYGKNYDDMDGVNHAELSGAEWRDESSSMYETGETYERLQELINDGLANALEAAAQELRQKNEARRNQKAGEAALRGASRLETQPATNQADANEQASSTSVETNTETGSNDANPGE